MKQRSVVLDKNETTIEFVPGQFEQVKSYCVAPIVTNGDTIGAIYLISKVHFLSEVEQKAAETAANFFAKQMEN